MKDFSISSDGLKLEGTLIYPAVKKDAYPGILFVHGWNSRRIGSFPYAQALADLGYVCSLIDMRGHGSSEGDMDAYTSREFLDDVIAAYDHLVQIEGIDSQNISAVGTSFGGFLLPLLARERKVQNLVLRAPADYPDENFDTVDHFPDTEDFDIFEWRSEQRDPKDTFALSALHDFTGDVLIIESEDDDRVPHQTILNYMSAVADKTQLTHELLIGAPHSIPDGPFKDRVIQILVNWFKERILEK